MLSIDSGSSISKENQNGKNYVSFLHRHHLKWVNMARFRFDPISGKFNLTGIKCGDDTPPPPLPDQLVEITGGDLVYDYTDELGAKWRVYECLGTTALTCLSPGRVQALVAGGGGGGGAHSTNNPPPETIPGSGAGGGGLYVFEKDIEVDSHVAEIGSGGATGNPNSSVDDANGRNGRKGSPSLFLGVSSDGGAGGQGVSTQNANKNGASGAGQAQPSLGPFGLGEKYFGNDGGTGSDGGQGSAFRAPGGGGGAGTKGGDGIAGVKSGDAGHGVNLGWFFGVAERWLCCGSAGGRNFRGSTQMPAGDPAPGGTEHGQSATPNTGNAGSSCGAQIVGTAGASGIVAVRYRIA